MAAWSPMLMGVERMAGLLRASRSIQRAMGISRPSAALETSFMFAMMEVVVKVPALKRKSVMMKFVALAAVPRATSFQSSTGCPARSAARFTADFHSALMFSGVVSMEACAVSGWRK